MSGANQDAMKLDPWGEAQRARHAKAPRKYLPEKPPPLPIAPTLAQVNGQKIRANHQRYVITPKELTARQLNRPP